MKLTRPLIAAALVAGALVSQVGAPGAGAANPKISFSVSGAPSGSSLLFIGSNVALKVPATSKSASLSRKFYNSRTKKYGFSVHLLRPNGTYGGPVVFRVAGKKPTYTVSVSTKGSLNVGRFAVKSDGWAKSTKVLAPGTYGKLLRSPRADGRPRGAGRVGVLKASVVRSAAERSGSVHALAGVACTSTDDQTLGGDCDADGVPNAVDADDNNNGVLDVADSKTEKFEATKSLPWSTLYVEIGGPVRNLNVNLADVTMGDIDEVMGGPTGIFSIAFYINMPETEADGYDAVWVDCGPLAYCARDGGTALTGPPSGSIGQEWNKLWCTVELNSAGGCPEAYPWRNYPGTLFDSNGKGTRVLNANTTVWNGLTRFKNNGGSVWAGQLIPNTGAGLLDKVKVADPYVLRMRSANGTITQRPMALGAFFVTVPVVTSFFVGDVGYLVDYSLAKPAGSNADPIQVDNEGTFSIVFYRPQRPAIAGADPTGATFMDMGGLRYGLILNAEGRDWSALKGTGNAREVGCTSASGGAYASLSADLKRTPDNDPNPEYNGNIWPLTDAGLDAVPDRERTLRITFDLKKCIEQLRTAPAARRAVVDMTSTRRIPIQLTAAGVDLEGGASRAAQTFYIELPEAASGW